MAQLDGKVALITGGGGGMGRAESLLMAERGADIVVQDLEARTAEETAALVRDKGRKALVLVGDVSNAADIQASIAGAEKEIGRIDILVNNAGIGQQYYAIDEIDEAIFDRMIAVHVKGTFFCTQAVVPGMKARKSGKIINIGSNWGQTGNHNSSHYCGAKAAILGLTKAWAKEFAPHGVHVNCVAPGWIDTAMGGDVEKAAAIEQIPLGRMGEPEEIAYLVAFLASAEADFITGQVICPNGGHTIVGI